MEVNDAIVVVPTLLLVAVVTVYALIATYVGLYLYEQTCGECGETLPSEEAFEEHMEEHMATKVRLHKFPSVEEGKIAA